MSQPVNRVTLTDQQRSQILAEAENRWVDESRMWATQLDTVGETSLASRLRGQDGVDMSGKVNADFRSPANGVQPHTSPPSANYSQAAANSGRYRTIDSNVTVYARGGTK